MDKPNVLFVPSQQQDYTEDIVYHGLITLLGRKRVVDHPYKQTYHYTGETHLSQSKGRFSINPGFIQTLAFRDDSPPVDVHFDDFDFVVLGSLRHDAVETASKVLERFPRERIVFLDGEDDPFVRTIYFKKLKAYFKREKITPDLRGYNYLASYAPAHIKRIGRCFNDFGRHPLQWPIVPPIGLNDIKPLPIGVINEGFKTTEEKPYDICFIANFTHQFRKRIYDFLLPYVKRKGLRGFIARGGVPRDQYLRISSQSKICINARGESFDTHRYWEVPYIGSMLLTEKPTIEIPHNFVEGESASFFKNIGELEQKLDMYLKGEEWRGIAKKGRDILMEHHTSVQRAKYVLEAMES